MQNISIRYGEELADVVEDENLFDAADLNGLGITDDLVAGTRLTIPDRVHRKIMDELAKPAVKQPEVKSAYAQEWIDMVLQELGDEERLFEMCDLNTAGITDELIAGTVVKTLTPAVEKKKEVSALKKFKPACGDDNIPLLPVEEGIEYWAIEYDFVVS